MRYWAIIGVGALLALSVSLISTVLTGRTEVRPVPFEVGPLEKTGGAVQRELDRLYTRYDDRLASLSSLMVTERPTSLAVESAASRIAGVRTATPLLSPVAKRICISKFAGLEMVNCLLIPNGFRALSSRRIQADQACLLRR